MRWFKFNMTTLKLVSEVSCLCQFNCVLIAFGRKAVCWLIEVNPANFHVRTFHLISWALNIMPCYYNDALFSITIFGQYCQMDSNKIKIKKI